MAATTEVAIVGGGICGVLAAQQCQKHGIPFRLVDKCGDFGGVWAFRANAHSHLQARGALWRRRPALPAVTRLMGRSRAQAHASLYQWDSNYPLDKGLFHRCPSRTVLDTIRRFAADHGLAAHAQFHTEVVTVADEGDL